MSKSSDIFGPVNRQRCVSLLRRLTPVRPRPNGAFNSAVIIPLCYYNDRHHAILYTRRSVHLRHYPGQVSFPGGRMESNESVIEAALRELEEEVGIPRSFVDVWTTYAPCPSRTLRSFIHPVVGFIGNYRPMEDAIYRQIGECVQSACIRINSYEVDMVFFRSLKWLSSPSRLDYCIYRDQPCFPFTGVTSFLGSPYLSVNEFKEKSNSYVLPVFGGTDLPRITGVTALLTHQLLTCLLPQGLPPIGMTC